MRWSSANSQKVREEHGDWLGLADDEQIEFAARTVRDMLVFTDRRLVISDTQGMIRKKTEYVSLPYRGITRWSVESKKGLFDGADLKIWLSSIPEPIVEVELRKDDSARDVMALLSRHAM